MYEIVNALSKLIYLYINPIVSHVKVLKYINYQQIHEIVFLKSTFKILQLLHEKDFNL